jgi:molybdate transport system substrate-binding protein
VPAKSCSLRIELHAGREAVSSRVIVQPERPGLRSVVVLALTLSAASAAEKPTLRVLAAASLTEVVTGLSERYEGARVQPSFGGSSALARQIHDGAPADVFLSASTDWIEFLREAGRLEGEPVVVAGNRLVCITSRNGPLATRSVSGPGALLDAIGPGGRVAIADEGVPAGEYARAALEHAAVLDAFRKHLVGQQDVRAVLHAVELGELDAGFVYATDAEDPAVIVLFPFDPASHPLIEYRAAVVRGTEHPEAARRFLDHLRSEAVRQLLTDAGFSPAGSP